MKPYLPRLLGETVADHADRRHAAYAVELDERIAAIFADPTPAPYLPYAVQIGDGRYVRR